MDPPPKRRKLNVSKRQERNRLAPVFRYLATADDSNSDVDYESSHSECGNTVTSEEGTQTLSQHLEESNEKDNQPPQSNEGEACAATSSEEDASSAPSDTDRYYESVDSYESNSCSDSSELEDEDEGWLQSETDDEEYVEIDSDYCEALLNPFIEIDGHKELEQFLGSWINRFNIPHSASNALLKGLKSLKKQNGKFKELPLDARTLLKTPRSVLLDNIADGKYWHFGLKEGIHQQLANLPHNSIPESISLLVSVDGIPLTKSSRSTFWPILGLIYGEEQPFPIGVYHGTGKPECVNSFLSKFIGEAVQLEMDGLDYRGKNVKVRVSGFICDAPARSFVAGTCGHTGKFACPKCKAIGINFVKPGKKKGRIVFPDMEAALRTHQTFIDRETPEHHKMRSVLEDLQIDMIKDIPLDYMHLVCMGVMRKLLIHWVNRQTTQHLITHEMLDEISDRLELLRNWVPSEFSRLPRSLSELCHWKATELRQFLLYTGPVVLKGIFPPPLYSHFLCFHVAIKFLCSQPLCFTYNRYCKRLLKHFARESEKLYGGHFITYNVHCLIHLPDDVMRFGPLDKFSSFPFENYLQQLKRRIRRSNNPLAQLVKRLSESSKTLNYCGLKTTPNSVILKQEHKNGPIIPFENSKEQQFKVAQCDHWRLSRSPPNNCVYLNNENVFLIHNVVERAGIVYLIGRQMSVISSCYESPRNAANILKIAEVQLIEIVLSEVRISDVKCKAMLIPIFNNGNISDDDTTVPNDDTFAVFPLLMEDKFR